MAESTPKHPGSCPITVKTAAMIQEWNNLSFLHWSYEPSLVAALLPPDLTVETFGGRAWVGLVPFEMVVKAGRGPELPWLSRFPETNVRTYVTAPDGSVGVHFFSLDASRLPAVLGGRAGYGMPYYWSSMSVSSNSGTVTYSCRRRWPGSRVVSSRVEMRPGDLMTVEKTSALDFFLTARWRLYPELLGRRSVVYAEHPPWPLHRAEVVDYDTELVVAAGLPEPAGEPLCHYSPGVNVRIGLPRRLGR